MYELFRYDLVKFIRLNFIINFIFVSSIITQISWFNLSSISIVIVISIGGREFECVETFYFSI